jgi:hypothetical protein
MGQNTMRLPAGVGTQEGGASIDATPLMAPYYGLSDAELDLWFNGNLIANAAPSAGPGE